MIARTHLALALAVALVAALPAAASDYGVRALTATDGRVFAEVSQPDGSRLFGKGEVIRLGQNCTAEIAGRGQGRWYWTADGTTVRVGSYALRLDGVPLIPLKGCVG